MSGTRRSLALAGLLALVLAVGVASASAATRYAAPGGTGVDPCGDPKAPCSIYAAADAGAPSTTVEEGDDVLFAPGEYSDTAGDLGTTNQVEIMPGITVRGEGDLARPRIEIDGASPAFFVNDGDTVAHLEIDSDSAGGNLFIFGGTVEGLISRNGNRNGFACYQFEGVIRDTACLTSGETGSRSGPTSPAADRSRRNSEMSPPSPPGPNRGGFPTSSKAARSPSSTVAR